MTRIGLVEGLPENLIDLEDPCPIFLFTKATKILRGSTINVYKFLPGFMLHMDFVFFNVESICVFTSDFAAIRYATSYPFGFTFRRKHPPLGILIFLVVKLGNQDNKVAFIRVDE